MEMQFKRFLSFVLALVMVLSYVPVSAFATDNATDNTTTSEETSQGSTTESSEAAEEPSESADDGIAVIDETDTTIDTMAELQTALETANSIITVGGILTVAEGESFDLNLNGCTVNMGNYYIENKGNLTITGGTLISTESANETNGAPLYNHGGTLTVNGGTYTGVIVALRVEGGSAVINDGTFNVTYTAGTSTNHLIRMKGDSLTINGGTFNGNNAANSGGGCQIISATGGGTTINGGTFTGFAGVTLFGDGTGVTVKGGSFDDQNSDGFDFKSCIQGYVAENTIVTVNGIKMTKTESGLEEYVPPVAMIGEQGYKTFAEALAAAAAMTGDVTVEIYEKVTLNSNLSGNFDSIKFVGKDTDAEIYLDVQGYITATGKKVAFEDLILSKSVGGYITNAGFMNAAFGVYEATEVTYTDCTFSNGSYASGEKTKVTYTGCTFYRSHDKYGLWAYGADVTVDGCTFADYRGIKMYDENKGANNTTALTVQNTNFSALNSKPAIVLTYGESVALEGNTYSSTGVFELDLDGAPNGTPITSDVAPTCVNDNGACGVLVDGKIYTTVAQAAEVATSGSTVTLLHNSTETVELPVGVTLNKNGYTAENVTVAQPAGPVEVATEDELKAALANGGEIKLTADIDITARFTTTANATIDLNGKTLNIKVDEVNFSGCEVTIKNGTIDVSGVVATADAIFNIGKTNAATLTLDTVAVKGETYSSAFGVFYIRANSTLNINGGSVNLSDEQARYSYGATSGGVFKADGSSAALNITGVTMELYNVQKVITHATTAITNSTISIKGDAEVSDKMEHGINRSALTVTNSTITMENLYGRGITAENGAVSISDNSTVTITNAQEATIDVRGGQTVKVDPTSTVTVDADPTITSGTISGDVTIKITPAGEIQLAYLGAKYMNGVDAFFGEAVNVVAKESFVVKLYFGETLVGTAELVDTNKVLLNGVSQTVTWHAALADDGDSWWNTTWNTTLNVNNIPDKVELWVDGVLVDTDVVELNNTDLSYPICAAVTDAEGNIQSFVAGTGHLNAQTPPDYDEALQAALTAGGNIVMLRDVTVNSMLTVADTNVTLDLNGKTITAGTLPENSNMVLYIINSATVTINDSVGTGGITNSSSYGYAVLNQGTLTVNGGTFVGDTALWNGYDTINSVATLNGGTFDYNGSEDEGYSIGNAGTLVINNGAVVGDWLDTFGTLTINGGTVDNVYVNTGRATVATAVTTISGGNVTGELSVDEAVADSVSITGGTFATDPTAYVAEGYAALPNLNDQYVVGEKPTATVKDMGQLTVPAGDYMIYGNGDDTVDMPLNFVMQFLADQTEEDMETSPYADWYGDFVITITGLENGSFTADDCYLAGYYGSFGWIQVPIDGMTIEEGARYPVMLGVGMGQKYDYICTGVKDFRCAMYIAPEILEANPNINVTLELSVVDSSKGEDAATEALVNKTNIYQVANLDYEAEDFKPTVAKIGEVEYKSLAEAIAAAKAGDTIVVTADHAITAPAVVESDVTIDLNGKALTAEGIYPVIRVQSNASVTIENGSITADDYVFVLGASDASSSGYLTIKSGSYRGVTTVASVTMGELVIEGGYFAVDPYSGAGYANYNYLLNCIDANYAYGTANIVVKGGSFENFNPADNAAEGVGTNFVDPLYESVTSNGAVWNVREIASGDERNPIDLTSDLLYEGDFSATVTVPAGNTYYFQAYRVGGMIMSINGGEGVDCVTSDMWTPYTWSITNDGAEAAEYVITVSYPVGDQMNPAQLVIGDNTATIAAGNTQGYYFTWTAADNGALTITMPEGNWMYVINNITTYSYGDTQWSDSDPVANPAIVEFAAGDELQIMVSTYDPANPWSAPAGEITFNVAEGYPAGHEKNPILLLNQQNAVTVSGETWYQGRFSGMIMTVTGEGEFSVIYNGETTAAVDGKVEMAVASANPRMPVIFAVDGEGDYSIDFTYPVGSMSNPAELVMGENTATIETNAQGYYYTWTATGDGELTITMPEGNWSYVINNMTTYSYGDAQFSDSDPVANPAVVAVNKGDELQIIVNTYDPAAWATPAGVITFTAEFTEAPGTEANPILLQNQENDVAQSGETWYQGRFSGMIMTVTGEGEFSVIYNGETTAAVDGKVEMAVASANPRMPVIFAVDGEGDYSIDFAYPLGNMDNPAQLVMGENTAVIEANAQGYYYTWTATGDGALTITMPEGNWSYVINNMTTYSYGDAQFSDSDPVANPAVVAVNQGDELQIIVNTYDPAAWATPAGVITFTAEFMVPVAQNETTGVKYGSVSEALAAAASGETVILLADAEEDLVYVRAGRTLNLNGKTLTANDVLAVKSAHIVDNSAANTGLLAVAADNVMISSTNSQLPVWNGTGYVFTAVDFSRTLLDNQTEDSFRFVFQPQFQAGAKALIENGVEDNDVTIEVRVSWMSDQGREYRNLIFKESQIITAISNANGAFILTFSGFSTIAMESDITVEAVVNSGTGVSAASAGTTVSIGK